jgi:hypothetical protein
VSRDLRRYARQTNLRLLIGFILLLFLVGDGLIYLIYGPEAATLGFVCLVAGLMPLLLIWLVFYGLEVLLRRFRE